MSKLLLMSENTEFLGLGFLKCGPWTSSISITWGLVTNANSHPRPSKSESAAEQGGRNLCFSSPPGDTNGH